MSQHTSDRRGGFTLIELLVVITILGVLATLLIANFSTARARARDARRKNDIQALKTALRIYYNDFQRYPQDSGGRLIGCGTASAQTACEWGGEFSIGGQQYMNEIPLDPLNNSTTGYVYAYEDRDAGDGFVITAQLENVSDQDSADSQRRCGITPAQEQVYVVCED